MTFGEKLKELREAAGLSEAKLADLSGVPFGTLHNYGLGLRQPTFAAVVKLAKALGATCEVFASCDGGIPEPTVAPKKKRGTNKD